MEHVVTMNMSTMIARVEQYPCIWDPSDEDYKCKKAKQLAWQEICETVIDSFPTLDASDKLIAQKAVKTRWTHVRDYFLKSYKMAMNNTSQETNKKKYMYYDLLLFLTKTFLTEEEFPDCSTVQHKRDPLAKVRRKQYLTDSDNATAQEQSRVKSSPKHSNIDKPVTDTIKVPKDHDIAFLESILPAMQKIPEEKKLLFRIDLLQLIQEYSETNTRSSQLKRNHRQYSKSYSYRVKNESDVPSKKSCGEPKIFETDENKVKQEIYSGPKSEFFEESFSDYSEVDD